MHSPLRPSTGTDFTAAATIHLDCDGRIATWTDAARDMFGRLGEAALGQPLTALTEGRQRCAVDNVVEHLRRDTRAGAVYTMELLAERADGTTFHVECSMWRPAGPRGQAGAGFDALIRDIGHRVRLEHDLREDLRAIRRFSAAQIEELRQTQSRFVDIAETIDEVFWMADPSITRMLYISPGYERVWGRSCQSLYDDPRSFMEAIHPDDRARVAIDLGAQVDGRAFDHEYRIVLPDGVVRWIWDRGYPVRNAAGEVGRYIGVAQDITARKAADAALRRQDAIDAIGQMAGGFAHDFSEVLGVVVGHLDLAGFLMPEDSGARESVELALEAALRGTRLAHRLTSLTHCGPAQPRRCDLAAAVADMRSLLWHAAGTDAPVAVHALASPVVMVDPGGLDAALITLAIHLRPDVPDGGHVAVNVGEVTLTDRWDPSLRAGDYASLSIDVVGPDTDAAARVPPDPGAAAGQADDYGRALSPVHACVRDAGGVLRLEATHEGLRRFRILLPLAPPGDAGWISAEADASANVADRLR